METASLAPKRQMFLNRPKLVDLYGDAEPRKRSLDHAASLALPDLR
jgi:hypothetical protein